MRVRDFSDRGDPGVLVSRDGEEDVEADDGVEGHSPSADLLASGYALQLENLGLLQEAVFVLLHIEGSAGYVILFFLYNLFLTQHYRREKAIKDLMARQAVKLDDWTMRGFCGSLKIPTSWVNEAKVRFHLHIVLLAISILICREFLGHLCFGQG
jgi:nuclear pore complex protein Nup98-Nup96